MTDTGLAAVRADSRQRWLATLVGAGLGLAVAQLHWLGFVLGGVCVGLVARDLARAVLAGIGFGVVAWLGFLAWLALAGTLDPYLGLGQPLYLSVAVPVLGGGLGSLARGVVP
jgi:threonine/homoserine/homoserine lactone efflux protein